MKAPPVSPGDADISPFAPIEQSQVKWGKPPREATLEHKPDPGSYEPVCSHRMMQPAAFQHYRAQEPKHLKDGIV
jgi:hypothetical protein